MKTNKLILGVIGLNLIFIVLAIALYGAMPEMMASHWNARGVANGTMSRFWGMFLVPFIVLGMSALLVAIPRIDPLKANIQKFQGYYYGFIVAFLVYFLYIYSLTLTWNMGWKFNFSTAIIPSLGFLMFFLGVLLGKAKRNFFIGIRTPWTLSSDEVWDRTHHLGGILFKIIGVVIVILTFTPVAAIYGIMALLFGTTIGLVVYSYVVFRKLGPPPTQPPIGR